MSLLQDTIRQIQPVDKAIATKAEEILDEKTGGHAAGFGALRPLLLRYLAIRGRTELRGSDKPQYATVIACADHGVARESVSAYPVDTTVEMMKNYLISRGGAANAFASYLGSALYVIDMGTLTDVGDIPGLISCRIANGTKNMAEGAAMTREEAQKALETGIGMAQKLIESGVNIILPGEMGISNTTSSAAITAAICRLPAEETTGRGTNISDERLAHKVEIVRKALEVNKPDPEDGLDVLAKVGGFELGCIAGLILGAAARHAAVILDGANSSAAALIAHALNPAVSDYLIASHLGTEKSHKESLRKLGLTPFLSLDLRLGEAIGSTIAAAFLNDMLCLWELFERLPSHPQIPHYSIRHMKDDDPKTSGKAYDYYLQTIQPLDSESIEACRERIDNLAKPIYSLGIFEEIANEFAGIIGQERPADHQESALIVFCQGKVPELLEQMAQTIADKSETFLCHAQVSDGTSAAAFDFGRKTAEEISVTFPIVAFAFGPRKEEPWTKMAQDLRETLLTEDGKLRYKPDDFLRHAPKEYKSAIAAMMGGLLAAAHECSLILLDDEATEIIARYTEKISPEIRPYLLHVQPKIIQAGITYPTGITALLGIRIVETSLHMLNKMKTFAEAKVSVAADGPGAERQKR